MTPQEFIRKWRGNELTERAAAQEHFIDLCRLFGHPTPTEADRKGEDYAFEKGLTKTGGGDGFADVWKRGFFAWEYKKRRRNLDLALQQLTRYASALENPPIHVACDTEQFRIVTAWTSTVPVSYTLEIDDLADPEKRAILHAVFFDPEKLRPKKTRAALTDEAATKYSAIAERIQHRNSDREAVAHFVNQLVFCFFAEDVKLLPEDYFTKLLRTAEKRPQRAKAMLDDLFGAMERGGFHGIEEIARFNGGLFDNRRALDLDHGDLGLLVALGSLDWSQIDPTIFGTLFERFLDPDKRAQIGAHYTSTDKIMMIVEPVIMRPLLAEWETARARVAGLLDGSIKPGRSAQTNRPMKPKEAAEAARAAFLDRLRAVRILDAACGSANFLYLALHAVKDLENRVVLETEALGLDNTILLVGPEILKGIEINPLAAELARTTVWIGYIQWKIRNGIYAKDDPILRRLDNIDCRDALLTEDGREAEWPEAEFIIGNPPFLGGKLLRGGLGDDYVETLFSAYDGRVPREADLVTYWFEKARAAIAAGRTKAAGLVSTNSIRGGANRRVLERLMQDATIFEAWSDEPWIVDGAAVRVSLVCFGQAGNGVISPSSLAGKGGRANARSDEGYPDAERRNSAGDWLISPLEGEMPGKAEGGAPANGQAASSPPSGLPPISPSRGEISQSPAAHLNGLPVPAIFSDLTAGGTDLTKAKRLRENAGVAFMGDTKGGAFDIDGALARAWLKEPLNPNGRPNSDVLKPWVNGMDVTRRPRDMWIIDFGWTMSEADAALYEEPFAYALEHIKPVRTKNNRQSYAQNWWRHVEPRPAMWAALSDNKKYLVTPRVSKHRIFTWLDGLTIPDSRIFAFARASETLYGVLNSSFHERWTLGTCSWHGVGNDPTYNSEGVFETFPFPEGLTPNIPAADYAKDSRAIRIAEAARALDEKRRAWLNPPDLVEIVPEITPTAAPGEEPVRYPDRILPKNAQAAVTLRTRTLTNLYNLRPQWLASLHDALDRAVAAAYGWPEDISTDEALSKLLALNLERSAAER